MMAVVAEKANFTYTLKLVNDSQYGMFDNNTRTWNGLIGELLRGVCSI